jgi:hypothetical protein
MKEYDVIDNVIRQLLLYKQGVKIKKMAYNNRLDGLDLHIEIEIDENG